MIRLTELRLPIDHAPEALEAAIFKRLQISINDLIRYEVFKRSYDARKNIALSFIYTLDLAVKDQDALLTRFANDPYIRPAPDTNAAEVNAPVVAPSPAITALSKRMKSSALLKSVIVSTLVVPLRTAVKSK